MAARTISASAPSTRAASASSSARRSNSKKERTFVSYDGAVALDFFKSAGKAQSIPKSQVIFTEHEEEEKAALFQKKAHAKLYFLLDGEVSLEAHGKPIATVRRGEIFGELAALTHGPRTATALAKSDCKLIALDAPQLERALAQKPGFALMMMSLLIARLRETIARLKAAGAIAEGAEWKEAAAFDPARMAELVQGLSDDPPIYYQQGQNIMSEGQRALRMYAVVKGRVVISIDGRVVEHLGPGGAFGEAALVEPAPRMASAAAETDCELQPITRDAFLSLVSVNAQFGYTMLALLAQRLRVLTGRLQ